MIYDLIRALPVTLLVCFVPGYFWSRLLCAAEDHAVRVAYSVALSITLVPALALAQMRVLNTGLTFTGAVSSALVVFIAGFAAYAVLGPAKASDAPLLPRPFTMRPPALVSLALAFAFALVGHIIWLPAWVVWAGASLLVLSAGATHLLDKTDEYPSQDNDTEGGRRSSGAPIRYALLFAVLLLVLARGYLGPVLQDWPHLRGDDQYQHTIMTEMMISEGSNTSFMLYPPGIHLMMAEVSHLTGLEPLDIFAVLVPALLVPPTLALYSLARRMWGWEYGVTAAFFYGVLAGGPYWYLEHGRYPNIIAAQFLMVLALTALFRMYESPSWRSGMLLALLGSSVVLYHQVGSLYFALLLGLSALLFLPHALLRERARGLALVLWLVPLGALSVLYAWNTYDLPQMAGNLLNDQEAGRGGEAVSMAIGTKIPESLTSLIKLTSQPTLLLGLFGILLMLFGAGKATNTAGKLVQTVTIVWTALMFIGSRTSYSGFPDRFERDLGVPLSLLAALAFVTILRSLVGRDTMTVVIASVTIVLVGTMVQLRATESLIQAAEPSVQLTMSPRVAAAGEWLENHNTGGNIVVSPYVDEVPSRGLLAMGGYTGIQSYDSTRIEYARDIPPSGPGPLWDALWLLGHPEGDETRQLLDKYDVRYLVFSKISPLGAWQPFADRRDLYRTVFENKSVIIFEPREALRAGF